MDESCSTVDVEDSNKCINTNDNKVEEERNDTANPSAANGRSSPEANCPICLGKFDNKSYTDSCLHQFCFNCLREWSKVKAECPLCKQSFDSIIHTVRSIEDYEEYYVSRTPAERTLDGRLMNMFQFPHYQPSTPREPFRYRTTVSTYFDYFVRLEAAISNHVIPPLPRSSNRILRHTGTSEFRRNIYQQGLWVQRTRDATGRVRDCSPEFYRANPASLHRLVPWLNRELVVLCNGNDPHIQYVINRILELVKQTPIRSPHFTASVSQHFGRHTEHFVHEFYCFASSPYDLVGYDRHATYVGRAELSDSTSHDFSDSEVEVLTLLSPSPARSIHLDDSDDCVIVDCVPARQVTPEVITLVDSDSDDDVVQVNISIGTDVSRPGSARRLPLKKDRIRWKSLQKDKSSNENVNVSINIAHSSRPKSPSSDSSSSYTPSRKSCTKIKAKSSYKKKSSKSKSSLVKHKSKVSTSNKGKSLCPVKVKRSNTVIQSSEDDDDSNNKVKCYPVRVKKSNTVIQSSEDEDDSYNKLKIVTDEYSSSSEESSYKPRLRSVVFKSNVKSEPSLVSPGADEDPPTGSYWKGRSCSVKSEMEDCSLSSYNVDSYGPSCSYKRRRYSSSSSEPKSGPKSRRVKTRSKRHAYW